MTSATPLVDVPFCSSRRRIRAETKRAGQFLHGGQTDLRMLLGLGRGDTNMTRAKVFSALAVAAAIFILTSAASAQLDDKIWVGGTGNQVWQLDANWQLNAMPTTFPNDPGRVDPDPAVITNVIGANLGVNLAANLSVDVGATNVTVAALTMGGTAAPVATNI